MEKMAKKSRKTIRRELRSSLVKNMEARGLNESVYIDKVEEYMDLWDHRADLEADIRERGVSVEDPKRGMMVENRSVSLMVQVSRQMLAIYTALGLKDTAMSAKAITEEEDEL